MKRLIALTVVAFLSLNLFAGNNNEGVDPIKEAFEKWTKSFVVSPAQASIENQEGLVFVSFELTDMGEMKNIEVDDAVSEELNQKAIEMVAAMPKEHLYANGFIEGTRFVLPIKFSIQ